MTEYAGLFKRSCDTSGKDWVRRLDEETLAIFVKIGLQHAEYGRLGGKARASTARRDKRGRFAPERGEK